MIEERHPSSNPALYKTSLVLSTVFSPLLVPTYAIALALWITPLAFVPERVRFGLSLLIFLITAAVPMSTIIFMIRVGKVADAAISNRRERLVPYIVTAICYIGAAALLWLKGAPNWLIDFYTGAALATLIALAINFGWKISAHATVMGGLNALVFFIAIQRYAIVSIMPWICLVLLCAGAVGSARIYLLRHSPAQVYAGFALGFAVEYLMMTLI